MLGQTGKPHRWAWSLWGLTESIRTKPLLALLGLMPEMAEMAEMVSRNWANRRGYWTTKIHQAHTIA